MVEAKCSLYRIDFCTDLTAVQAPIFNIGFMLEAAVHGGARFLGLASRRSLTRVELDRVNLQTWPELAELDSYMGRLFEDAWDRVSETTADDTTLGSVALASSYSSMTALTFGLLDMPETLVQSLQGECDDWQKLFYGALCDYGKLLKPTLSADVLPFAHPASLAPASDARPKVRSEAA